MSSSLFSIATLLSLSVGFHLSAQTVKTIVQQQPFIQGLVVDIDKGIPISRVAVELQKFGKVGSETLSTKTNDRGEFGFFSLPEQDYQISVRHPDYAQTRYGAIPSGEHPIRLALSQNRSITALKIKLSKPSVISGRVLEPIGRPAARAPVNCEQVHNRRGKLQHTLVARATTNDLGEYRIFGLPPGVYALSAASESTTEKDAGSAESARSLTTYFPNASLAENSELIRVEAGEVRSRIDIRLRESKAGLVSGNLATNSISGSAKSILMIQRISSSRNLNPQPLVASPAGRFVVGRIPAGKYSFVALSISAGVPHADAKHLVWDESQENREVKLELKVPGDVSGRLSYKSVAREMNGYRVALEPEARMPIGLLPGQTDREGRFRIRSVFPTTYEISIPNLPRGHYISSASAGQEKLTDLPTDLTFLNDEVEVSLSDAGAVLNGRIEANHDLDSSTVVWLTPIKSSSSFDKRPKEAVADHLGRFSYPNLAPGEYTACAFQNFGAIEADWIKLDNFCNISSSNPIILRSGETRELLIEKVVQIGKTPKSWLMPNFGGPSWILGTTIVLLSITAAGLLRLWRSSADR